METIDTYLEHRFHQEYHTDCSECYKEDRVLRAFRIVNTKKLQEELGYDNQSALRGGLFGQSSPWDKDPRN